jgi:hypothetical protein
MGTSDATWWDAVSQLPPSHQIVAHEPETPRYQRAGQKLRHVVREGVYLGLSGDPDDGLLEIAVWAPSDRGRGPGYYCCFRLFIEEGLVSAAVLFAFYDGTDESSPGFSTLQEARAFARSNGFS